MKSNVIGFVCFILVLLGKSVFGWTASLALPENITFKNNKRYRSIQALFG